MDCYIGTNLSDDVILFSTRSLLPRMSPIKLNLQPGCILGATSSPLYFSLEVRCGDFSYFYFMFISILCSSKFCSNTYSVEWSTCTSKFFNWFILLLISGWLFGFMLVNFSTFLAWSMLLIISSSIKSSDLSVVSLLQSGDAGSIDSCKASCDDRVSSILSLSADESSSPLFWIVTTTVSDLD